MGEPQSIPAAPGNLNTVVVPTRAFNEVKTVSLEFVGDHALLKDNVSDWANTGTVFPKPEFTFGKASAPVSRTRNKRLSVQVELEVWPYDAPMLDCTIKGTASWGQTFETKFPLKGGKQPVILESAENLPDKITRLTGEIVWVVNNGVDGDIQSTASWGHEVFVTMDTPLTDKELARPEDGVTLKRMRKAMGWVEPVGSLKPHEILAGVRENFSGYRLNETKFMHDNHKDLHHPNYMDQPSPLGGAWPMADYMGESGECQAQVRLQRAVLRELGVPGEAKVYVVWADPSSQRGGLAIEDDWESNPNAGCNEERMVGFSQQYAALVDGAVTVGTIYPPSHMPTPDGTTSPGLNRYEACLRFTADGETKYYGGGAGVYKDKDALLSAPTFWGLIWVEEQGPYDPNDKDSERYYKVIEIVRKY
jgi:hypothetical protein